jgi:hypothetical protein
MAQNMGRMTIDPNDPNYAYMAKNIRNMFFNPGDNTPVPFMMDRVDQATRNALLYNQPFTPQQWATLQSMTGNGQANAAANPDGTVSFNNWTYDDETDHGKLILAAMAAAVGGAGLAGLGAAGASGAGGMAGLEAAALAGAPGAGTALGSSLAGAGAAGAGAGLDAAWGVNQQGAGMDFLSEGFGGGLDAQTLSEIQALGVEPADWLSGLRDLAPQAAPTNLQDKMTALDTILGKNGTGMGLEAAKAILRSGGADLSGLIQAIAKEGSSGSLASILGKLGAAGLGAYASNQQSNALTDLASKYQEYGAPSRARYEASMAPGFDPMSVPGYSGAVDTASKSLLARLSASGGNPFGNPGGLIDANKQIINGTAMPAVQEYQRLNANTGFGNSMNAALGLQKESIGADANLYNSIGYGLNAATNPQPSITDIMKQLQGLKLAEGTGL